MGLFDAWAAVGVAKTGRRRKLNAESVSHYRTHWRKWVVWITSEQLPWNQVTSETVTRYLAQIAPRAHASDGEASTVTRRRYWRLLRDIYRHALVLDWIPTNPCDEAEQVPRSEAMESMILLPWALQQMQDGIVRDHDTRANSTWRDVRDDALMLVLIHTALKTSEIQQLRVDNLWFGRSATHGQHYRINVDGPRQVQKRQLPLLDRDLARIFAKWMKERASVEGCPSWVFFGQKTKPTDGTKMRTQLTAKSVFKLVSQTIQAYVPKEAFEGDLAHVGGETLRNSVIAGWISNGLSLEEVKERSGVAELRAIARLDRNPK